MLLITSSAFGNLLSSSECLPMPLKNSNYFVELFDFDFMNNPLIASIKQRRVNYQGCVYIQGAQWF